MLHHAPQFLHAFFVGRDLRPEVGDVLLDVAHRVLARGQQGNGFLLPEAALLDQEEVVDEDAFFLDEFRFRGHRARGDSPDVRVVSS